MIVENYGFALELDLEALVMYSNGFFLVKLLTTLIVVASLASLPGYSSNNVHLQIRNTSLPLACQAAAQAPICFCPVPTGGGGCSDVWAPSGPAEDTLAISIFTDEQAEFSNIQSSSPTIDLTDSPLPSPLLSTFTTSNNFLITSAISQSGYYEIQFMLASNFWGCNFNFGNSACGVQIRQGMAHMLDTAKFAANESSIAGQAVALDTPVPSDNVGSLPVANPCGWDTMFPESGPQCIVGAAFAAGGTAYHLAAATGANSVSWLQAPGSKDLDAAAAHFVAAGIATGCDNLTGTTSCINSKDSLLTGISSTAAAHAPNFFIRNDSPPRLDLGNSLAEQICYMFTGSYNTPCNDLSVTRGPIIAVFPGFTSTTTVNLYWSIYTAAYQSTHGPDPFDQSLYFTYNSRFASVIPTIASPSGPCSTSGVPTLSAADYMYLCNPAYDNMTSQMEFANCLTVAGDPVAGQTSNNSTGACSGGGLSSVGAGVEAENLFGRGAYTLPIFEQNAQFGFLNNGWIRTDINNVGSGLPNYFTWLDAWNPSPVVPGTIRQGFKQTTDSVSPFLGGTPWDSYVVDNVYDSLALLNPLSGGQLLNWMVLSIQTRLPLTALTYNPPPGTTQTFRFTLRSDLFFQDGTRVTAFDVAFSYLALKGTGALLGAGAAPITGITVLTPTQFDINLNAVGPFTLLTLTGLPILPGAYWSNAGSTAWAASIATCTATNSPCYPAQYTINSATPTTTSCAISCVFLPSTMNVNVSQTSASYDPITGHSLVGSGPWECGPVTSAGSSTSCSSSGAQNPPVGGGYTLSRFSKGLSPGSSLNKIYFRSNGNLALYLWSLDNGDITHDFLNYSVVASCFGATVTSTGPCAHFQQGIGAPSGGGSVGLSQVAIVNRFVGLNWIAPFNWQTSPPIGVVPLNPVLYENTAILNPASAAGCSSPYPTGGYDC